MIKVEVVVDHDEILVNKNYINRSNNSYWFVCGTDKRFDTLEQAISYCLEDKNEC